MVRDHRLHANQEPYYWAWDGTNGVEVPIARAHDRLRPMASHAEAQQALKTLHGETSDVGSGLESATSSRAVAVLEQDLEQHVQFLRELYALPDLDDPQRTAVLTFEALVLAEISVVLERPYEALRADMRERYPAFDRQPTGRMWRIGQRVFVRRHGLGTVFAFEGSETVVKGLEATVRLSSDQVSGWIRGVLGRDESARMIELLCAKLPATRSLPALESSRAFDRLRLEQQFEYLRIFFRAPRTMESAERGIIGLQEPLYVDELAEVLGTTRDQLRAGLRKGAVVLAGPARTAPTRAEPTLRGHELIGEFAVVDSLVAGDPAYCASEPDATRSANGAARSRVTSARPGIWFAFSKLDRDGEIVALVAVHSDSVKTIPVLRKSARALGLVWVDSGQAAIIDGRAASDPDFMLRQLEQNADDATVEGRGCRSLSGSGDGTYPVHVAGPDDAVTLVWIEF